MAEEEKDFEGKSIWLLIKGCTESPQRVKVIKRKGENGQYLEGMKYDFPKMQRIIERTERYALYNTVENMRSLKCKDVLKEIKNFSAFAKKNRCRGVHIYYTGHGEKNTGNWCFSDGVINLKQVLNAIKSEKSKRAINIHSDACYSGNWVIDLNGFKNKGWGITIKAASFPGNVAYDTPNGGMFTAVVSKSNEEISGRLHWCLGNLKEEKYSVKFYRAERKID